MSVPAIRIGHLLGSWCRGHGEGRTRLLRIGGYCDLISEQHLNDNVHGRDNHPRFPHDIGHCDISARCSGNDNPNYNHHGQLSCGDNYGHGMQQNGHGDSHVDQDDERSDHGHVHRDHYGDELWLHDHCDYLRGHYNHDHGHSGRRLTPG